MNIKSAGCGCTGNKLTKKNYDSFLFNEIKRANKENRTLVIVSNSRFIYATYEAVALFTGANIYAKIVPPLMSLGEIEHLKNPL